MARVALLKLFTGLNLAPHQLAGELRRAGHEAIVVYFKDFLVVPLEEAGRYQVCEYPGVNVGARAKESIWNCYTPFSDAEYGLLFEVLRRFRPQLIGMSLTALTIKPAAEVTERIRREFPDVKICWGGAGPTLEPEACLEHADLVCRGEGEEAIVELAERIDAGASLHDVRSVWSRRDGEVLRPEGRPLRELEEIAIPEFEPTRTYHINDGKLRHPVYPPNLGSQYPIMTTRGCPFSCSFCVESVYQDMFGKKNHLRRRSVDVVIRELVEAKKRLGIRSVLFYDDVFTTHPKWLREFAPRYKAEVGLPFWCYTYPTTTKREDILLLKDAGMRSITMGIQSGSEQVLEGMNRPVDHSESIAAAKIIAECGVEGYFDLITRVQLEKEEHCRETFNFLVDLPIEMKTVGFGHMTMFPTYGYTKKVEGEGHHLSLTDKDYSYYHRLYLLTRTNLPRFVVRQIGRSKLFRRFPELMDPLLPKTLPFFFLGDGADEFAAEIFSLPHAQAVIPGGELDRGLPAA